MMKMHSVFCKVDTHTQHTFICTPFFLHYIHVSFLGIWRYFFYLMIFYPDANSNKLFVLLELHSSFRFQYRLLTKTTFFEIAVYCSLTILYTVTLLLPLSNFDTQKYTLLPVSGLLYPRDVT